MESLIFGRNPVLETLEKGRPVNRIFLLKGQTGGKNKDIVALARKAGIPVDYVERRVLTEKAGQENHQGVLAEIAPTAYCEISDLLAAARNRSEEPLVVVCDHIEDPHNLGAIMRSAEAFGAHGIILPKKRAVQVNATVVKSSAGAALDIPVARVSNLVAALEELKKEGLWVAGTDVQGEDLSQTTALSGALAVVIGNEGQGISPLVRKHCDFTVRIPMAGQIQSLNASAAAAIILYEILRRKQSGVFRK